MLLRICVLALLWRKLGVHILKLLRRDERHTPLKLRQRLKLRIYRLDGVLRVADGSDDVHRGGLEIIYIPVFREDDLFPVPLIDIHRMEIIQHVLIAADSVHIRAQPAPGVKAVAFERHALPLGKRMHNLGFLVGAENIKRHGALYAVEIVIETRARLNKQRCGHAVEIQKRAEPVLKKAFEKPNGFLRVIDAQKAFVAVGDDRIHFFSLLFSSLTRAIIC